MFKNKKNNRFQFATRGLLGKTILLLFILASLLYTQNLILKNITVSSAETYSANDTIFAGPDFTIDNTGDATLKAGNALVFNPGTVVLNGGILNVLIGYLRILPEDTTIQVQQDVQYNVQKGISHNYLPNDEVSWYVKKDRVGPVSEDGHLYAYFPGNANIMAKGDTFTIKTGLTVVDTTVDESGMNIINIIRNFPNEKAKNAKKIKEGEEYILAGIKSPGNILNGTRIYFPHGSLHQDITIEIDIPKFTKIKGDSIQFANKIINGICFNVFVNDTLVEPYYFDKPVSFAMPFKRGILKHYGIKISDLSLFFATDTISFDSLGVSQVFVDSTVNLVYGLLEHFSNIVLREKEIFTSPQSTKNNDYTAIRFSLQQNYPNPFNPVTTISYQVGAINHSPVHVELSIYNILGQKVKTLVSEKQQPGQHQVQWDASGFASGIYYYMIKAGEFRQVKKMVLVR